MQTPQRLRVLHLQAEADLAGCERTCQTFIQSTPRHFESTVLLLNKPGPAVRQWESQGANVICRPIGRGRFETYTQTYLAVRSIRPDFVILWTSMRLPLMVSACRMAGGASCAVHIGNPVRFTMRHRLASFAYGLLPRAGSAMIIPASHHIAASIADKPSYRGRVVRVCHNGIDLGRFAFRPKPTLGTPLKVGMSARLDSIKDHQTLLLAWAKVLQRRSTAILELAGDGPLRNELEHLSKATGIAHAVRFLGRVNDMVERCYSWDVVAHSTTKEEGLGNSMIEAMALGRPLVASDVGPVREIVGQDGAILVPAANPEALAAALLRSLDYESEIRLQIVRARTIVEEHFSSRAMVETYLNLLTLQP